MLIATSPAMSFATSSAMSPYTWWYSIQYVVMSLVLSQVSDKRTIVTISMTMSSGGHRGWVVTHLL